MLMLGVAKMFRKISKIFSTKWRDLTLGEKAVKVIIWGIVIAFMCYIGLAIVAFGIALFIAIGVLKGMGGAVQDEVNRSRYYRHRRFW